MLIVPLFGITIFLSYTLEFDFPTNDFSDDSILYPTYYEDLQLKSEEYFDYNNYELALRGIPMDSSPIKNCKEEFRLVNTGETYYPRTYLEINCIDMSSGAEGDNNRVHHRTCKQQDCKPVYRSLQLFEYGIAKHNNNPCWKPAERINVPVGCRCGSKS